MLTISRRVGECFTIGTVVITRVIVNGRDGLRYEVPGLEPFTVCTGKPRTQMRIAIDSSEPVVRTELTGKDERQMRPLRRVHINALEE